MSNWKKLTYKHRAERIGKILGYRVSPQALGVDGARYTLDILRSALQSIEGRGFSLYGDDGRITLFHNGLEAEVCSFETEKELERIVDAISQAVKEVEE